MKTGFQGTFVISWTQTEVDGLTGPSLDLLRVGATWRWTGAAVRVDGPQDVLILNGAEDVAALRAKAAGTVRRLVGAAVAKSMAGASLGLHADFEDVAALPDQGFVVTDGRQSYVLTLIHVPGTGARLIMAMGEMPPMAQDLWVVRTAFDPTFAPMGRRQAGGVICFTPGTRIATEQGPRLIQDLRPGMRVLTRDNGPQEIIWTGSRRMSGARLYAMPHLRPVRIRAGAYGIGRPEDDLLVSPQHRMVLKGRAAQALFNTDEVLVAAEDLVNDTSVLVDHALREVTYIHLLLDSHNILWANGMETESFHPSNADLDTIEDSARERLLGLLPYAADQPQNYGDYARRNLSTSEAAILRHEMAA